MAHQRGRRGNCLNGLAVTASSCTGLRPICFSACRVRVGQVQGRVGERLVGFLGQVVPGVWDLAVGTRAGEAGR